MYNPYSTTKYSKYTPRWRDYFDYNYECEKSNCDEKYRELLQQLQNSANIIGSHINVDIRIKWSGGKDENVINNKKHYNIYISPDDLLKSIGETLIVNRDVLDALTGQVYTASMMRETVKQKDYRDALLSKCKDVFTIWDIIEQRVAINKLNADWAGFTPEISHYLKKYSSQLHAIQGMIDSAVTRRGAYEIVKWNILFPDRRITPSAPAYRKCVDYADKCMINCEKVGRLKTAKLIVKFIDKHIKKDGLKKQVMSSMLCEGVKNTLPNIASLVDMSKLKKPVEVSAEEGALSGATPAIVKVKPCSSSKKEYGELLKRYSNTIQSIRNRLKIRDVIEDIRSYGKYRGDIDENSLFKLRMKDEKVMMQTDTKSKKSISIGILIDESGSMGTKIDEARAVGAILTESFRGIPGITIDVYGHTAEEHPNKNGVVLREYYTKNNPTPESIMSLEARRENHDSWAVLFTGKEIMKNRSDYEKKIIFVISDGMPGGTSYGGMPAIRHMNKVCKYLKRSGVEVYGIGIPGMCSTAGAELYGKDKFIKVNNTHACSGVVGRFIQQVCNK